MRKVSKKLTDAAVIDIMTDKTSTAKEMAARYGIDSTQIYQIHKGKLWKHISLDPKYTPRNFKAESTKITLDIATKIKSNEIKDYDAIAEAYGVTVRHLKKLRNKNYIGCWKTIPIKY